MKPSPVQNFKREASSTPVERPQPKKVKDFTRKDE